MKEFKADGYYANEMNVEIQVSDDLKEVRLFNNFYDILSGWLTVKNGVVHFAQKDYLIENFIPYRNKLELLQTKKNKHHEN